MVKLKGFPKNKEKFVRLIEFFKQVLDICESLNVTPIIDGGLAVFAYTGNQSMDVNDVDASVPETEFPRIIKVLKEKRISFRLREWHVLQVLRDDLKIDLGSLEYWLKDVPENLQTLQIDNYKIKILSLARLKEFYRQGMEDRAEGTDPNDKIKYGRLKTKYEILMSANSR